MIHPTFSNTIRLAQTLGLILSVAFAAFGQTPKMNEARKLLQNQTLEREMTGAETHRYKISLQKDEFFQVRVEQKGVDAALKLLDASGKTLATMDSPNSKEGPETLSYVAVAAGGYILEISGFDAKAERGNYSISRIASREPTANDKRRVVAEIVFQEAMKLRETQTEESWRKALAKYEEALSAWQELKDDYAAALMLSTMAYTEIELGDNEQSAKHFISALRKAEAIKSESLAKDIKAGLQELAKKYHNAGLSMFQEGTLKSKQAAAEKWKTASELYREAGDNAGEANTQLGLGGIADDFGEKAAAIKYYEKALPLYREVGDKRKEAATLSNIGLVYSDLDDKQQALKFFNQSLPLRREVGDKRGEAATLNNLMIAWERQNNLRLAILYGKQSVNVYQSLRANIKELDKNLQQSFLGTVEYTYRRLAELLIKEGRIPEAEQVLAMLKEEEYFQIVRGGDLASVLDKRLNLSPSEKDALERYDKIADELTQLGSEYAKLEKERTNPNVTDENAKMILARQGAINEKLKYARIALDKFLEALKKEFSQQDKRVAAVEEGLQAEVKGWGDPRVVVISTVVGKENLSIIVTTSDVQTAHIVPITEEKLNTLVGEFRAALTKPGSDPRPAGQKLYDVLIKPVQKDLDGVRARTLIWSLDDILRYAPMSALWDADKGYLVQRYANVVITLASRGNLAEPPKGKTKWQVLGVGVSKAVGGFNALSNVPGELSGIVRDSSVLSKTKQNGVMTGRRLLDEQFTYDAFRSNLGRFKVVHAPTHFEFISGVKDESLESFLLLGNGEKLTLATIQSSGTIFNDVQLLALSACDTAYGGKDADGREVEGFGAMAQKKGAKAVLATLWRVDDESTRDLMIEFYGDYQKPNFTKAEALRQAQLALLQEPDKAANGKSAKAGAKKYAHPYFWAPFVLIGNWE